MPEVPNSIDDYVNQLRKIKTELEASKISFSYLSENKKGEIPGKSLELGFFISSLYEIYQRSGGGGSVTFGHPKDPTSKHRTGNLMQFLEICFEDIPEEFVPSNKSLGDKIYKIIAKSKKTNLG